MSYPQSGRSTETLRVTTLAHGPHAIPHLRNFWYVAAFAKELPKAKMKPIVLCDEPLLLLRSAQGTVSAMRNVCPHHGPPLHHGKFDGQNVQCHYHGWKFGTDGRCTSIPALSSEQAHIGSCLCNKTYPCLEKQGLIWVFIGDRETPPDAPTIPGVGLIRPQVTCSLVYPLNGEHSAYSFFDPAHVAFVHRSPMIKRREHSLREKRKTFEPMHLGWQMARHPVPAENKFYRLFGRNATTEIHYQLPGSRTEFIQGERHCAVSLATVAPVSSDETVIHQALYWTFPYLWPLKGVLRSLVRHFLNEDRVYAHMQREGLAANRPFMLMGDADTQIQWFQQLRKAWLESEASGVPFVNPLSPRTLHFWS